ncbi:ABC transporter ATP-binding protein [Helicobacter sp. 14348-15]|uniref:ABC transporter ATP-binding protein n=1 Tax=Helicobacter TaxID=209 RepID=UPI00202B7273|nr:MULTISPECIES: ABC transporter ATP-binding protein [Helicobacter]MCL9821131.1 ABC transporter ATP-binding protein [Helicobacter colisuis]MDY5616211.1 ABC transporter ATP-binding protein [Helicobacter sp.]
MLLEAKNLSFGYEKPIIENLNFQAKEGEIISIMGVSGSGKSTLLHLLSSFLKPQNGEVSLFDLSIYSLPQKELLALRRKKIGIIFQSHYLFLGFSAYENLQVASLLSGEKIDKSLLKLFGIEQVLDHNIGALSGGQQQRLSIARILTKKPQIIFADEPTGNLDRETAMNVMESLFAYVRSNHSLLIFVTHDPLLAHKASRSYKLENATLKTLE